MIEILGLTLTGVSLVKDIYFQLKDSESVKAELMVNNAIANHESIAVNFSVVNITKTPFSILNIFMQHDELIFHPCRISSVNTSNTNSRLMAVEFVADTGRKYKFTEGIEEIPSYELFDTRAYLLENQAEMGWVIFKLPSKALVVNKVGLKITGTKEILYATTIDK